MEQARLFQEAEPTVERKTFLSRNVTFFNALTSSSTLAAIAKQAVVTTARAHGSSRNSAGMYEDRLVELLLSRETLASICEETISAASSLGLEVSAVTIQKGPPKALADVVVFYTPAGDTQVSIAVNIKRLAPGANATEGGSILSFLRLALDASHNPMKPPSNLRFDWEAAIVEWVAGLKKIRPGRDYYFLTIYADGGKYEGLEAWPIIAGTVNGRSIVGRHSNRAVLDISRPTGVIGSDVDPNHLISTRLLPTPTVSVIKSQLVAAAGAADVGAKEARLIAGKIGSLSEEDLSRIVKEVLAEKLS